MSNYLSEEYRINQPVQLTDINLVRGVLGNMQGKYDKAKSEIDQTLAMYNSQLKGLRDSDNAYISEKLKRVEAEIRTFSSKNGNLAMNYNRDSIMNTIKGVLDDEIVRDAMTSSQNNKAYDTQYAELIKKDPKLANDANHAYGKYSGGYYDYMSGKTNKLGAMQYTLYTDITEENLKRLKNVKDIKGKRFIEEADGQGRITRREIDGLEDWEINKYLGSTMSPKELSQMRINAWAKFGAINIEQNRPQIEAQYSQYNSQKLKMFAKQKEASEAIANNTSVDDSKRAQAKLRVKEIDESISDLQSVDLTRVDTISLASNLEKLNYLNGISQIAKAEWSTEIKTDTAYFETAKLSMAKEKFDLDKEKFAFEKYKFAKENSLDVNGNPLTTDVISQTPLAVDIAKTLSEEGMGQTTLKREHDLAHQGIMSEAKSFFNDASDDDIKVVRTALEAKGVVYTGGQFKFADVSTVGNASLANTVYETFKASGMSSSQMFKNYEVKQQKAKELIGVRTDGIFNTFKENPEKYIQSLRLAEKELAPNLSIVSDVTGREENINLKKEINDLVGEAGGWDKLEDYLSNNKTKLQNFADLTERADEAYKGVDPYIKLGYSLRSPETIVGSVLDRGRTFFNLSDLNLKKDAKENIEKSIQSKTNSGVMMSAYNQFNIIDDKVKERFLKRIPTGEVASSDGNTGYSFDGKENITIRKRGEDIVVEQMSTTGTGAKKETVALAYTVSRQSDLYADMAQYMDLDIKGNQTIKAEKNAKFEAVKVKLPSYTSSRTNQETMLYKATSSVPAEMQKAFAMFGQPGALATKEMASETIDNVLVGSGIPKEKVEIYKQKLFDNINTYKLNTIVKQNPKNNFRNEFVIQVLNADGDVLSDSFLETDSISYETKYSMETYPQIYVMNQLIFSALRGKKNFDNEINKL